MRGVRLVVGLGYGWALFACDSENGATPGDGCVPGRQVACACPDGEEGVQRCEEDGTFATCECPDAAAHGGAGGTGGTGATTSNSPSSASVGGTGGGSGNGGSAGSGDANATSTTDGATNTGGATSGPTIGGVTTGSSITTGADSTTGSSSGGSGGSAGSGGSSTSTTGSIATDEPFDAACPGVKEALNCGESTAVAGTAAQVLLVIDKSGSMAQTSNASVKWDVMRSALETALGSAQASINFGLELFPTPQLASDIIDRTQCGQQGNCCEMPSHSEMNVPIGAAALGTILQTLDATQPGGGTPTGRALERALEYFTTGAGSTLLGPKYVLLATDGGPNCNSALTCGIDLCTYNLDDMTRDCSAQSVDNNCCNGFPEGCVDGANVVNHIENLANVGIGTFVVGIPGSEAYSDFLDDFAVAGGHATDGGYYRVDDVNELASVFEEITAALGCDITLPMSTSVAPRVLIDCEEVPMSDAGSDNWAWPSGSAEITLSGACDLLQSGSRVDVLLDCPSQ